MNNRNILERSEEVKIRGKYRNSVKSRSIFISDKMETWARNVLRKTNMRFTHFTEPRKTPKKCWKRFSLNKKIIKNKKLPHFKDDFSKNDKSRRKASPNATFLWPSFSQMIINRLWLIFSNNNATFANVESELDCSVIQNKLIKRRGLGAHWSSNIAFFFPIYCRDFHIN